MLGAALVIASGITAGADGSRLPPLPESVAGVSTPVVSLCGTWRFCQDPVPEFWLHPESGAWAGIEVPGECAAQGFRVRQDVEFAYQREVPIPSDFRGKRILLRFDGAFNHARVWVNGVFIRDHFGGFTSWFCDLTPHVEPGTLARVVVGITDRRDDISNASEYAKHSTCGLLRPVFLVALPVVHLESLHQEVRFDSLFRDAVLSIRAELSGVPERKAAVLLRLTDPEGGDVILFPDRFRFGPGRVSAEALLPVSAPFQWTAENPRLYTLEARLVIGGETVETVKRTVGFREVRVTGNRLTVNGRQVLFRGVDRHDAHPLRGRSTTRELDETDARLCREANINFVRTSHYPPSEAFLEACDRTGLYVEEETAVCFLDSSRADDPGFTPRFLSQLGEMVERDRNHASVVLWSLGNESRWGRNFKAEYDFVKAADPSRPVIFSWPGTVPDRVRNFDILSVHYPDVRGRGWAWGGVQKDSPDFTNPELPELSDEFAHVPCYNTATLRADPNVRNFWGRSLALFWDRMFAAGNGCLGGAIWCWSDEVFMLPDTCVGYGPWGVVDGWRRKKPEFWLVKKGFSPVKMLGISADSSSAEFLNRFDHTDFSELCVRWRTGSGSGILAPVAVPPRGSGAFDLPVEWRRGSDALALAFMLRGALVDSFRIGPSSGIFPVAEEKVRVRVSDRAKRLIVDSPRLRAVCDKGDGLIQVSDARGNFLFKGPFFRLGYNDGKRDTSAAPGPAAMVRWELEPAGHAARIFIRAAADTFRVEYGIRLSGSGLVEAGYRIFNPPATCNEIGLSFEVNQALDRIEWKRKGLWDAYPADHLGRERGTAMRAGPSETAAYRQEPVWPWIEDMRDFFLFPGSGAAPATNDFRSLKENILEFSLSAKALTSSMRLESEGTHAARVEARPGKPHVLHVFSHWTYPDLDWGNDEGKADVPVGFEDTVRIRVRESFPE
jgi:hypothetical protein